MLNVTPKQREDMREASGVTHEALGLGVSLLGVVMGGPPTQLVAMLVSCGIGQMVKLAPKSAPAMLRTLIDFYEAKELAGLDGDEALPIVPDNAMELADAYAAEASAKVAAIVERKGATLN
jgi:hypothetical protein